MPIDIDLRINREANVKKFSCSKLLFFCVNVKRLLDHQIPVSFLWFHEYHGFHLVNSGITFLKLSKNQLVFERAKLSKG